MTTLASLAINDETASHRIVGTSEIYGNGILGYYRRDQLAGKLRFIRQTDPAAQIRVEPHNNALMGKALRSTDVEWIVNSAGELGVKIGDQFVFMYKGESFMYGADQKSGDRPDQYRVVRKREFGENGPMTTAEDWRDGANWLPMDHTYNNNELAYFESGSGIVSAEKKLSWDVFCQGRWTTIAEGDTEQEALDSITLDPERGPYKVIRWYGHLDPRNCVESGGTVPNPS